MPQRFSPNSLGLAVLEVIKDKAKHSHRRLTTSFIVLRYLFEVARRGAVRRAPAITALGSTLQGRKGGVGPGNQFAHQVLRELSIDCVPVHLLNALEINEGIVLAYCASSVSQIAAIYNETDILVERLARAAYIKLAQRAIQEGYTLGVADVAMRPLWEGLLEAYDKACVDALTSASMEQRTVLQEYRKAVGAARKNSSVVIRKRDPKDQSDDDLARPIHQVSLENWEALIVGTRIRRLEKETDQNLRKKRRDVLLELQEELEHETWVAMARDGLFG